MNKKLAIIILSAGKSTRMKSTLPKVLHKICGKSMLSYVIDLARSLSPKRIVAVLGRKHELVKKEIPVSVKVVLQRRLIGTADAVRTGLAGLKGFKGTVLILYGDVPLLKKDTVTKLFKHHIENKADATLLSAQLKKPKGYGRILRDKYFSICGIAEEKDADEFDKDIKEINTGIMCFNKASLDGALGKVRADNEKKEFYLTDIIKILYRQGKLIEGVKVEDNLEAIGINSRVELASVISIMQSRINKGLMLSGVSIVDPKSTFISYGTRIGKDSVIYPFTVIESDVKIGKRCSIGPFAHLREGARILDDVTLGNFLEITRAKIGRNTFAKHFCYIADSRIGNSVNIGAGAITANFDGSKKHHTVIKDKALIGSDTIMVAPVKIGRSSKTGAGSVIIKDVPDRKTAVGVPARILKNKG
ncbi:MAG: NTP transferase domain-containing protein [Candidatus Omnitrophica bacterium]|nr:NTP transferase domain-containing protein [Candidatus Omnitrophota bacterium]